MEGIIAFNCMSQSYFSWALTTSSQVSPLQCCFQIGPGEASSGSWWRRFLIPEVEGKDPDDGRPRWPIRKLVFIQNSLIFTRTCAFACGCCCWRSRSRGWHPVESSVHDFQLCQNGVGSCAVFAQFGQHHFHVAFQAVYPSQFRIYGRQGDLKQAVHVRIPAKSKKKNKKNKKNKLSSARAGNLKKWEIASGIEIHERDRKSVDFNPWKTKTNNSVKQSWETGGRQRRWWWWWEFAKRGSVSCFTSFVISQVKYINITRELRRGILSQ